jgi:hypothetical protein
MVKALPCDFKSPVWFGRIKNMPRARMRAQVGQLHAQNIVFLGLKL